MTKTIQPQRKSFWLSCSVLISFDHSSRAPASVITDHYSLLWLNRLKDPTSHFAGWAMRLQQYSFELLQEGWVSADDLDAWYTNFRSRIENEPNKFAEWSVKDGKIFRYFPVNATLSNNILSWKLLVPKRTAHLGFFRTLSRLRERCYWPHMRSDVRKYLAACEVCAKHKAPNFLPFVLMG